MRSGTLIRVTVGVLLILVLAQGVHAAETYSPIKNITVNGHPWGIAVDSTNGWVYVADKNASEIFTADELSQVTNGYKMIHAWSYADAERYISMIIDSAKEAK